MLIIKKNDSNLTKIIIIANPKIYLIKLLSIWHLYVYYLQPIPECLKS